ncbi:MAG TPA: hypothetical protein VGJ22_12005 [Anaerolineales bacterium]
MRSPIESEDNLAAQDESVEDVGDSVPAWLKHPARGETPGSNARVGIGEESGLGPIPTTGWWKHHDRR